MNLVALVLLCGLDAAAPSGAPKDSLTVESRSARGYVVMHKVDPKETWYSIARRYSASVSEMRKLNADAGDALTIGQIIKVPVPKALANAPKAASGTPTAKPANTAATSGNKGAKTHTVVQGEGLFSVARKYNVAVADLRRWNNLADNNVRIGQVLVLEPGQAKETSEATGILADSKPVAIEPVSNRSDEPAAFTSSGFDMVKESGMADLIDDDRNGKKPLALHKTAPAGTILKVRNELNGSTIIVRVIGKLPDTGPNDQVVIRLSKSAYERLNPGSRRIPVEVSYPAP